MADQMVPWIGEAPSTWAEVIWPEWVPGKTRCEVVDFWGPRLGRKPRDYAESITRYHTPIPAFGERVRLRLSGTRWAEGRYVHAWNNIGRLVRDDGSVAVVSTCDYPNTIPAASPAPRRDPLFAAAMRRIVEAP